MREAVDKTGANASVVFVPPSYAADAVMEAADAGGIGVVVCITEGIPTFDMMRAMTLLKSCPKTRLIGPNCPGIISCQAERGRNHSRTYLSGRAHRHRLEEWHADR